MRANQAEALLLMNIENFNCVYRFFIPYSNHGESVILVIYLLTKPIFELFGRY